MLELNRLHFEYGATIHVAAFKNEQVQVTNTLLTECSFNYNTVLNVLTISYL